MSIFNFNQPQKLPVLSSDWQLFQQFMGNIGAFTYIAKDKAAYLDPAARAMLSCSKEKINEFEFFNLLEKISKNPVEGYKHIYRFSGMGTTRYIKMNIFENNDEWLGFVQDFTRQLSSVSKPDPEIEYDPVTRLMAYPAFSQKVKKLLPKVKKCFLASVYINGLDKLGTFLTIDNTNCCVASAADSIRQFESDDIIISSKTNSEICILFLNCPKSDVLNILSSMNNAVQKCIMTDEFGEIINISDRTSLSLSIGCAAYPDEADNFNTLMNYSRFALYEAKTNKRHNVCWFSEKSYIREKDSYKNAQLFSKIIRDNLLTYHFQPIIEAQTGEIYGYEALMRTTSDIKMSPEQIIKVAEGQHKLYAIEKMTFFNTLEIISANQDLFAGHKLFINSIPGNLLTDDDFNDLYITYGELLERIVVEAVEQTKATPAEIEILKKRCRFMHAQIAIDDYGAGYSNTSNILSYSPDYIKIDRALITDINNDMKKQQLVASLIEFCHENKIQSIAEGVETVPELKTVIRLGADLIQGFCASKPKPLFINSISSEIKDEIIRTNLEARPAGKRKIYTAKNDTEIDLLKLALEKYTDIHICQSKLTITGDPDKQVTMNISVMDNQSCELTLKNVNIASGSSKPTISIGEYARLSLILKKNNKISHSGIYVPSGSQAELSGPGNLTIDCNADPGIGIGNDYEHPYGDIIVNMTGTLEVTCNCINAICIGGGLNGDESEIRLLSGDIHICLHTHSGTALGNFSGDAVIDIAEKCRLDITVSGIKAAGIGSCTGIASITSSADIDISCSGAKTVGIGSIDDGDGSIIINKGCINIKMRSAKNTAVGSIGGSMNTKITNTKISIDSEGDECTGIGDMYGTGNVALSDSEININILASDPFDLGTENGNLEINDSVINSIVNNHRVQH